MAVIRGDWFGTSPIGVASDFFYALRALIKRPITTVTSAMTLAIGVAGCTVIFSAVDAVLLRPLPYKDSDRLVRIHGNFKLLRMENIGVSPREFLDYREMNRAFEDIAAFQEADLNVSGQDQPERVHGVLVSDNLFQLLGSAQEAGRLFLSGEYQEGRDKVTIISDNLWAERYARRPDVIGSEILLNGAPHTIVGVIRRDFGFRHFLQDRSEPVSVWLPLVFSHRDLELGRWTLGVFGKRKRGISLDQAQADIASIANGFVDRYPEYRGPHGEDGGWCATTVSIKDEEVGGVRTSLFVLMGAVGVLLLIACANVANLLMMRGLERRREIAIRSALGASWFRILRQVLIENLIIANLGAGVALVFAFWARRLMLVMNAGSIPRLEEVRLDGRVLGFCLLLAMLTPILFGLLPAIKLADVNLADSLNLHQRFGNHSHGRLRRALVITEVGLSLTLLISAGLLMTSFVRLRRLELGFKPEAIVTARLDLPGSKYSEGSTQAEFFRRLLEQLVPEAGVESSSLFTNAFRDPFSMEGNPFDSSNPSTALHQLVGPRFFATLQIPVLKGREFVESDSSGSPGVAIINKTLADRFFLGRDPLNRKIKVGAPGRGPWLTVVGVVADVRDRGPMVPPEPTLYLAYQQAPLPSATLALRYHGTADQSATAIRRVVGTIDKEQPVYKIENFGARLAEAVAEPRLDATLLVAFSLIALVLALVGVYSVVSYSVSQRVCELGVRIALGAKSFDIAWLVIRTGMALTLSGIAVGIAGALLSGRLLSSLLFNVNSSDPLTFLAVSGILGLTALIACLRPALRAARVDPVALLRQE